MNRMDMLAVGLVAGALVACGGGDPKINSVTVSPSTIAAGDELTVTIDVENFELVNPDERTAHALRAAEEEHGAADGDYPSEGHFHVYMDSFDMTNPLKLNCPDHCEHPGFTNTVRASTSTTTPSGMHEIIVLLNNNQHMTLLPHIMGRASFTVQ